MSEYRFRYAHNTPLEVLLELGLVAGGALIAVYASITATFVRAAFVRRSGLILNVCGAAICVLAGLHSVLDFSLQIPGFTIVFAALLGALWPQCFSKRYA